MKHVIKETSNFVRKKISVGNDRFDFLCLLAGRIWGQFFEIHVTPHLIYFWYNLSGSHVFVKILTKIKETVAVGL
ncbi:MAG TPA: hypothetical protein DHV03_00930 [Alphaproteobacteria bacterium]|nr:hypothetical protein [Alphaproteobacteria bacterium]